jgi:hypothetical protein
VTGYLIQCSKLLRLASLYTPTGSPSDACQVIASTPRVVEMQGIVQDHGAVMCTIDVHVAGDEGDNSGDTP